MKRPMAEQPEVYPDWLIDAEKAFDSGREIPYATQDQMLELCRKAVDIAHWMSILLSAKVLDGADPTVRQFIKDYGE